MITMKTADGFVYRKRAAGASNASPQKRQKSIVLSRKKSKFRARSPRLILA